MPRLVETSHDGERCELRSPTAMPRACGFLWNRKLLLQVNCRGFAVGQHMQPEPAKYSHAPLMEQPTFMLPEQPLYAHHPGRFVYVKDEASGELFSVPHEPVRRAAERFVFSVGRSDIGWRVSQTGIAISWNVSLPLDDAVELWELEVRNTGDAPRRLSLYAHFTIGYMSWMNQSASYRADLGGIVASSVTPYQKLEDFERVLALKDKTFLLHDTAPVAWESCRDIFEGEGGLSSPDAIRQETLGNGDATYEVPVAALQYRVELAPGGAERWRFLFGPARDDAGIRELRQRYLGDGGFAEARNRYRQFLTRGKGCLQIATPDRDVDTFVNNWLDRQVFYHGDSNRLTTDPQTRNFLQDSMGMVYIQPDATRRALLLALAQQAPDGSMPDGIVLGEGAELKYINQVPHSDHCVWLPVCLQAYLDETSDYALLEERVPAADGATRSVFDRVTDAMRWLDGNRDARGLSLIAQGDWCDPMNMVGHKGKGVSAWLSLATVHAFRLWAGVCNEYRRMDVADKLSAAADTCAAAIQEHFWHSDRFARGITDDGKPFGIASDDEASIFLNPQSWAILSGVATPEQASAILDAADRHLATPWGMALLAPPYTKLREDVGRLTQKAPGTTENGAVYNHATTFYLHALYEIGDADRAWDQLRRMIPGPDENDYLQRGQLPVFVPNYYRGAMKEYPRTAGRSSQLFNTGAASWLYRVFVEGLFGLKGTREGLLVSPKLPSSWRQASSLRRFRGADFRVSIQRANGVARQRVVVDGIPIDDNLITDIRPGTTCEVEVLLPAK